MYHKNIHEMAAAFSHSGEKPAVWLLQRFLEAVLISLYVDTWWLTKHWIGHYAPETEKQ